ncbi:MAG: ISL3 family transposase [Patescibacteria group bacterium]|nr:ISL3 family transposase [Patescibacteria group bacterium]
MKKYTNKLFNLQGLLSGEIEFNDKNKEIIIQVRSPRKYAKCQYCGKSTKRIHQSNHRKIKHGILDYRVVALNLFVRRFKCCHCKKVFTEQFPGIDRRRTTVNFRLQMLDWLQRNSFRYIGQKFNIAPSTLVRYLLEMNGNIKIDWAGVDITKLGIDEHSFRGKRMIITITDLSNKKLLAILRGDSQKDLEEFIDTIPNKYKAKINEVCTDLRSSFVPVINKCFQDAIHTADRFHVEVLARRALDEIRTIVQDEGVGRKMNLKKILWANKDSLDKNELKRLDLIFKKYQKYPILKQAYIIKEEVIHMYRASSEEEAEKRFKHVMMLLETPEYSRYLTTLKNTMRKWRIPILNYFKNKTTNGFTEGCHTKIKMIKRVSFGFRNINNYIAKVTLAFLPLIWMINYHTV